MQGSLTATSLGIAKGTTSLVRNTLTAGLGSVGRFGSSLSTGMLAITGDDEYMKNRTMGMIRQKPQGIAQGIGQGFNKALSSGYSGLQGVVEKPAEGFRQEGIYGLMKGTF
jgi:vacuolar protein sorting-associated protein 13A/C